MMLDLDILRIISNDVEPTVGKLLISEPLLNDLYFSRSVVLITDELDSSFMGFVLNNESEMLLEDVLDGFNDTGIPLFIGGPVEPDVLFYIHKFGFIEDAEEILDGLFIGGDLDVLEKMIKSGEANSNNIRFFLGNAGWGPNQLSEEIIDNAWLVAQGDSKFVFNAPDEMWRESLGFVSDRYQIWKNFPIDPELN